jgi:hypothetical protein
MFFATFPRKTYIDGQQGYTHRSRSILLEEKVPALNAADIEANRQFFAAAPGYWAFDLEKERLPAAPKR